MAGFDLVIEYGAADEDAALALARRLFAAFDETIDSLALLPVAGDDLALYLNGRLVGSRRRAGRAPLVADVRAALAGRGDGGGEGGNADHRG
ncbi:MAG TPA: hypothetical protein VFW96_00330 [Thermomicrobiales bacterium]|nr:hypothetical protein [Thermomicrobiales bacterium]